MDDLQRHSAERAIGHVNKMDYALWNFVFYSDCASC